MNSEGPSNELSGKIFETGTMESWGAGGGKFEPQRNLNGTSAEVKEEKCSKNRSKLLKKLLESKKVLNCSKMPKSIFCGTSNFRRR